MVSNVKKCGINLSILGLEKRAPYIGREDVIRKAMVSLFCAYKKSIAISGSAGCGKTSFVRELACRLNQSNAISNGYFILEVSLGSVISDTGLRGEFERKIETLIETVSPYENVALFIDEGHSIANTKSDGGIGAMDLFKPFMLEQNLKLIIATTSAELAHIQRDTAFFRRFHHINLSELSTDEKMCAMRLHIKYLEEYHGCRFCYDNLNFDNTKDLHDLLSYVDLQLASERFKNEFVI
ncbi:AAA family ATPase [Bartonella sp. B17]